MNRLDPDALALFEEQRDFLLRSLDDLEREHEAGDVDDHDYEALKDDYTVRAAAVLRAIDEGKAEFAEAARPSNPWRTAVIMLAVTGFAILVGVLMAQASGRRGSADTVTGDIDQSVQGQLNDCLVMERESEPVAVLQCYDAVLEQQPAHVPTLTYRGWFLVRAGASDPAAAVLLDEGLTYLDQAVELDPDFPDARVFRAVAYDHLGDVDAALAELDAFDALHPPADAQQLADSLRQRLEEAASTTTTTSTATTATTN